MMRLIAIIHRDLVRTNIIESYERILDFIKKHLSDPFYLEGIERRSLRDAIFREVASNVLIHREYASGIPARLIIEYGKVTTYNANRPHGFGLLDPETSAPYPKNPVIGAFFRDEVVLSQVVDWETPGEKTVRNEFDCLLMKNNRLFLIECKTLRFAEKGSDVLYKLDSLTESSTGVYGRGALVSARHPDDFMQSRAAARKHRVFGPEELGNLQNALRQWIAGSL